MKTSSLAAWAVNVSLPRSRSPARRCRHSLCAQAVAASPKLSPEELAVGNAAVKVTHLLLRDPNQVTTLDLLAFCNTKSLPLPYNIWDRRRLESTARQYLANEELARTKSGAEWDAMSDKAKVKLLHDVCNGEGDVTYVDPPTGYTVFTFYAHLKRGHCCGLKDEGGVVERTHRCRHCPYTDSGQLGERMRAMQDRIPIVDYVRKRVGESWHAFGGLDLETKPMESSPTSEAPQNVLERGRHRRLAKVVKLERKEGNWDCEECSDERVVTCTRCSGWTYLFSPQLMKCPQCDGNGFHPCMKCTAFRPPPRSSFYA